MTNKIQTTLRFKGSVWSNVDVTLRNLDQILNQLIQPTGLSPIEWYILRALYEQDGQHASQLARVVGRAATSFTPNLDKLERKHLIERRSDPTDRRAVRIHLTKQGEELRSIVTASAKLVDTKIKALFSVDEYNTFLQVLHSLQNAVVDETGEVHVPEKVQ